MFPPPVPFSPIEFGDSISLRPLQLEFNTLQLKCFLTKDCFTQDPAKPVSELNFPSVTICSPGLNMEAVEEAVLEDFDQWLKANSKDDQLSVFMEEKYARTPTDGSIFDQIKAMNSPPLPSEESEGCKNCGSSQALHHLAACQEKGQARKKRSSDGSARICINYFFAEFL